MSVINELLANKSVDFKDDLKSNSLLLNNHKAPLKCRWGGHKQGQVLRTSTSRKYAGTENIGNAFRDEALLYERQLIELTYAINQERSLRLSKGYKSNIRKHQADAIRALENLIREARSRANECKERGEHHATNPAVTHVGTVKAY